MFFTNLHPHLGYPITILNLYSHLSQSCHHLSLYLVSASLSHLSHTLISATPISISACPIISASPIVYLILFHHPTPSVILSSLATHQDQMIMDKEILATLPSHATSWPFPSLRINKSPSTEFSDNVVSVPFTTQSNLSHAHISGPLSYTASLSLIHLVIHFYLGHTAFPLIINSTLCSICSTLWSLSPNIISAEAIYQHLFSWYYPPYSFLNKCLAGILSCIFSIFSVFISQFSLQSQTVSFSVPIHWHTLKILHFFFFFFFDILSPIPINHSIFWAPPDRSLSPNNTSKIKFISMFSSLAHLSMSSPHGIGFHIIFMCIILGYWHFLPPWSSLVPLSSQRHPPPFCPLQNLPALPKNGPSFLIFSHSLMSASSHVATRSHVDSSHRPLPWPSTSYGHPQVFLPPAPCLPDQDSCMLIFFSLLWDLSHLEHRYLFFAFPVLTSSRWTMTLVGCWATGSPGGGWLMTCSSSVFPSS